MEDIPLPDLMTISRHLTDLERYQDEIKEHCKSIDILISKIEKVRIGIVNILNDKSKDKLSDN